MKNLRQLLRRVSPSPTRDPRSDGKRSHGAKPSPAKKRRLISETLESRQLLAGDVLSSEPVMHPVIANHNYVLAQDVNNDGRVTAVDALQIINQLNRLPTQGEEPGAFAGYTDVNRDNRVTAVDALMVVNTLNRIAGEEATDLVELVLSARSIQTDELLSNVEGATDVLPTDVLANPLTYNVDVGDVFKIEIAVQDRRDFANGVFQVAVDLALGQSGVLEPAIGEVQQIIFDGPVGSALEAGQTGTIEFFYADDPTNIFQRPLADFGNRISNVARSNLVKDAIIALNDSVSTRDDVNVVTTSSSTGGPSGVGFIESTIVYSTPLLANLDVPQLIGRVVVDGSPLIVNSSSTPVFTAENEFNMIALAENFEYISRNSNPDGTPFQIYGQDRGFGSFVRSATMDVFNEIGAIGPTAFLPAFFEGRAAAFEPSVAYDAFSIPVRAIAPTNGPMLVALDPSDEDENVLLYGTEAGDENIPTDALALDNTSRFFINVSPAPTDVVANDGARSVAEDTVAGVSIDLSTLTTTATSGATITYSIPATAPPNGSATLVGSTLTFVPDANFFGTNTVVYTASSVDGADTGVITFTVTPVNDNPVAMDDGTVAAPLAGTAGQPLTINVLANDNTGPGATPGTFEPGTLTIVPGSIAGLDAAEGTAAITGGQVVFTPALTAGGTTAVFTYTVSDGELTAVGTIRVAVAAASNAITTTPTAVTVVEDAAEAVVVPDLNTFVTTVPAAAPVTFRNPTVNSGSVRIVGSQLFYTPAANVFGTGAATINYVAEITVDGQLISTNGTVTVNITGVNDAPVDTDAATPFSVPEGTTLTLNVLAGTNPGPNEGTQTLSITAVTQPPAGRGTVSIINNGQALSFVAPDGQGGEQALFTYTLTDSGSGVAPNVNSTTVNVIVNITDVVVANTAPVAVNLIRATQPGTAITVDVAAAGSDAENNTLTPEIVTGPTAAQGVAVVVAGGIRFTPAAGFTGQTVITYRLNDGQASNNLSNNATLTINVSTVVAPPVAGPGNVTVPEDGSQTFDLATVTTSDPNATTSFTLVGGATTANGRVTISGSTVTYTPNPNFFGSDSFRYRATNSAGSSEATVSVSVTSVNDLPTAGADAASTLRNTPVTIDVLANDSAGPANENQTLTLISVSDPANGSTRIVNGRIVYTPDNNFVGAVPDTFTYVASDGQADVTGTVNVTVRDFTPSTVRGRLFVDAIDNILEVINSGAQPRRSGQYEPHETVLGSVGVSLQTPSGETIATTLTQLDGTYEFRGVAPGAYDVVYRLPTGAIAMGDAADGVVSGSVGPAGGETDVLNVRFLTVGSAANYNSNIFSIFDGSTMVTLSGGATVLLDGAGGSQVLFQASAGFDMVDFAELALNDSRDQALLTVVRGNVVETARIGSEHLIVNDAGTAVRLVGGYADFDFDENFNFTAADDEEFPQYLEALDDVINDLF